MESIKITLGAENNSAEVLLNRMVETNIPIEHMVIITASLVHCCDTGFKLDEFENSLLDKMGYESNNIIQTLEDYHAMKALEIYLDEELPMILAQDNKRTGVKECHFMNYLRKLGRTMLYRRGDLQH